MTSIAGQLARSKNRPAGFDYMRFVLATAVILQHTVNVSYGEPAGQALFHGWTRIPAGIVLPMFFSLSGFLVAGSLERSKTLVSFLGLRAIRLLPALAFEITLSALILGLAFTTYDTRSYFLDPAFRAYFWNFVGWIHYTLPGVFLANPDPQTVNGQLWTIPFELKCYMALAGLALLGIASRLRLLVLSVAAILLALAVVGIWHYSAHPVLVRGPVLVECFLTGVTLYRLRDAIPYNRGLGILSAILTAVFLVAPYGDWFLPIPLAYLTTWLGTMNPPRNRLLLSGDYSYGLYLYGFPIQQAVASFAWTHVWWLNFVIAYPIAFLLAAVSWWCIERPAQRLKGAIFGAEDYSLRFPPVKWHSAKIFGVPN